MSSIVYYATINYLLGDKNYTLLKIKKSSNVKEITNWCNNNTKNSWSIKDFDEYVSIRFWDIKIVKLFKIRYKNLLLN